MMFIFQTKSWVIMIIFSILLSMITGTGAVTSNNIVNSIGGFKEDTSAPTLFIDGNLSVVFIGALFCPYCAMERWAVAMALSDYGNFSGLGSVISYEDNIASYNFINATYNSTTINFQTAEIYDNSLNYKHLEPMNSLESELYNKYASGYIPFLCIGGSIFQYGSGSSLLLKDFEGLSFNAIKDQIASKTGVYNEVRTESNYIQTIVDQSLKSTNTKNISGNETATIFATLTTTFTKTNTTPDFELVIFLSAIIILVFSKKSRI